MRSRSFVLSVFVLCAILIAPATAFAQGATFGVEGGINVANVSFSAGDSSEPTPDFKSKTRGVFGIFMARDFNPKAGLQVDVLYSQKGTKATVTDGVNKFTFEASVDYIEIPVLIRGNIGGSGSMRVRVFAGPSFGFKVAHDTETTFNGVVVPDEEDEEFTNYDIGFVIGGAVQFGKAFVDVRYNWGFVNVATDDGSGDEVKTRTLGVMVGFRFK